MSPVEDLCDWLKSRKGYLNPSIEVRDDPVFGLSAFATDDIVAEKRLVSCPFELAITPELATRAICDLVGVAAENLVWPAESSQAGARWNERMRIATYIALHWVKVEDEGVKANDLPASLAHYPYIAALPPTAELSTPLWFTSSERDLLTGTNLRGAIEGRENEWKEEAAAVRSTLRIEGLSWERYLSAATYLSSRAFPARLLHIASADGNDAKLGEAGSHPVLLPGIDLFNHARGQPITWLSSNVPDATGSSTVPSISLVSAEAHKSGSQIFNNYGPKPNDELLLGYGFVLDPNPDDIVTLKLGQIPSSPAVQSALAKLAIDPAQRFVLRRDGDVPKDLLEVLRVILSDGTSHDAVPDVADDDDEEDEHEAHEREVRLTELELEVCGTLGSMLDNKLETLDATEPDESVTARPEVRRICAVYRQGQREILQAALDKLEQRSDRLEKMIDQGMGGCSCCA